MVADAQMATGDHRVFLADWVLGNGIEAADVAKAPVLDIRPREHDPASALMIHLAMGQPLDPNNLYQIAAIASANPDTRILTAGNPSTPAYHVPTLSRAERRQIAAGNFAPLNQNLLQYATAQRIETADQYGYSFGADKALSAASAGQLSVNKALILEPVTAIDHSLPGLGIAFASSNGALKGYVTESGPALKAARKESVGMLGFNASLARLSNLAIARGLAKGDLEARARDALQVQDAMDLTVAWGSESELADDSATAEVANNLAHETGRVKAMVLPGQRHALANDVWLQAAIVAQSLR